MYVKELDIFLTVKVLENTPAVLSLGKVCDEHGYSYEWINGQKKFAKGMGSWWRDRFIYRSMGVPMLAKCWSVLRHCIER